MKTILVLHTGGTISMSKVAGGSVAPNEKNPLMEQEALFSGKVHLVVEDIFNIPSPHMTLERMFQLKERIQKAYSEPIDGVVITHGTDTLEETAYFLDLVVKSDKPVVLVGSMRPGTAMSADGPLNLYRAVILAGSKDAVGRGVMVMLNDTIHSGREVTKTITDRVDTFQSPVSGVLGFFSGDRPAFYRKSIRKNS